MPVARAGFFKNKKQAVYDCMWLTARVIAQNTVLNYAGPQDVTKGVFT